MRFERPRRVEPSFNLTPLMDILFIVLIFLVLTTTFKEATTFQVQLPTAQTSEVEPTELPGLISISVSRDGALEMGGESVTLAQLEAHLASTEDPTLVTVRLRADAEVNHGVVVEVMDTVRRNGISQLSIETRTLTDEDRQDR